ncbi:ATP-dependent zinc metalloprotease FtsH [bacterium]|nr:ATP-dependent zinc metalloprotease FtsH [bacterium]
MPASFNWLGLITSLLPSLLLIAIFIAYFSMMKKGMGSGQESIFSIGKSGIKPAKTNVRFTDVAGIDEVKEELKELVDYIKNPNKYSAMGARAPKGVILYGPPGTGKTLIAKAVAGEANCNFFATSGSSFEDMLVGVGAKRVRDLFSKARKLAPTIVFIDEIDSVASKRGKNDVIGGGSGVADQTINQLLAEMDGFTTDSGVIVIAATNRIDVLDDAILRPGRFDRQIQVTLPDIKGREQILKIHAKNKNLSSEVNLMDIARRTPGFSGAQLENVLNEAAILAVRQNKVVIKTNDIDEAIDRVIGGPARHGRVITEEEKRQIASHEAGHALVGLHTKNTEIVQKITIIPRGDAAGYTLQTPQEQERTIQTKEELLNQVRMTLGGRAAEEVIYGESQISTGAANDLYKVSKIVKAMVLSLGMSKLGLTQFVPSEGNVSPLQPKMFSETTARELDLEIEEIIQKEYKKAKEIIIKNRKELDLIVETLMTLETIMKNQIDYIHENLKLPKEVIEFKNKSNNKNNEDNEKDQDDKLDNKKKKD